jgi:hypothetical protein
MDTKPRMTKQGIRDLNYYGPKPARVPARPVESIAETSVAPSTVPEKPDAPLPIEA